jgi:hypothetical protein
MRTLALTLAALDLAPSFAHLLVAYPRLFWCQLSLWREATVLNGQYIAFALIGAPLELSTIGVTSWLAWRLRAEPGTRSLAVIARGLFGLALITWFAVVAPANASLATWHPGPMAADAGAVRLQWETGHILSAPLKLSGFIFLAAT